jgi:hypothetical protein
VTRPHVPSLLVGLSGLGVGVLALLDEADQVDVDPGVVGAVMLVALAGAFVARAAVSLSGRRVADTEA